MPRETHGVTRTIFSNSGSVSVSQATANMKDSALYQRIPACAAVDIILNVTAHTAANGASTLNYVELQDSPDNGTTWFTFWRSAQITTSTTVMRDSIRTNGLGDNEAAVSTVGINTVTGAVVRNCVVSPDQRVKWTLSAAGGVLTFGLYAVVMPSGSRSIS